MVNFGFNTRPPRNHARQLCKGKGLVVPIDVGSDATPPARVEASREFELVPEYNPEYDG